MSTSSVHNHNHSITVTGNAWISSDCTTMRHTLPWSKTNNQLQNIKLSHFSH